MVGRFFEPDEKICIIIDNVDYAKLRELPEFSVWHKYGSLANTFDYPDMPCAKEWAD